MKSNVLNFELKRNEGITTYFGKDHDRLNRMFNEYQLLKHSDFPKAKEYFDAFRLGLLRHFVFEEEILYPLFEEKALMLNAGPTFVMRLEHKQITQILKDIYNKLNESDLNTGSEEDRLIRNLFLHNNREENVLYSVIDDCTSKYEREEVFIMMNGLLEELDPECPSAI